MYCKLISCIIICTLYFTIINALIGPDVKTANQGQFPFIVSVKRMNFLNDRKPEEDHVCTGTLLSKRDVLTLASCEDLCKGYVCEVKVGSVDIREGATFYIEFWMSFTKWATIKDKRTRFPEKDVALIRLSEKVLDRIPVLKRSSISDINHFDKRVQTAGWGCTMTDKYPRFLLTADMTIVSNSECENLIYALTDKKPKMHHAYLCSRSEPSVLLSRGDNGAPIVSNNRLIAIHKGLSPTTLPDHNDPRKININISIFYFKEFIDDVINNF